MNKDTFIRFGINHSDEETVKGLLTSLIEEFPLVREELWEIFTDLEAGFIVIDDNDVKCIHPKFKRNGVENEIS
jgi:hypothetical protein